MISILYSIIIFPLVQIIEISFLFIYRVFDSPGLSLLGVSFAITLLTLPLYIKAEEWQARERNIQQKMSPKIKKIKAVFKGDEQYMVLSTYYRQNHYHPVFALRSTFGLLIQVPFFIAAWSFISGLESLNGYSFLGIADLGVQDGLLQLNAIHINILPIAMTVINLISCMVYTKGFVLKEKLQLYFMAALFLVLLYNSPSGLVLYWTFNNIFSLIKNFIQRFNIPIRKLFYILLPLVVLFDVYILFIHRGGLFKRILVVSITIMLILLFVFHKKLLNSLKLFENRYFLKTDGHSCNIKFFLSISILFLLSGLVIPSALIVSSPEEFSFIESYKTPFPFIFNVFIQSFGFFVFWPVCLYLFFSNSIKKYFSLAFSFFALAALVNTFTVFEDFGFLTNLLIFSEPKLTLESIVPVLTNIMLIIVTIVFIFFTYNYFIFRSIQLISICALLALGITHIYRINSAYNMLAEIKKNEGDHSNKVKPFFTLSREGKNVLFIMLDMAMPGFIPEIFNEKPEILSAFSDFTWYPNCASFGGHTFIGAPPIYGGYEYAPLEINRKNTIPLADKHREAYLLLPLLFSNASWSVTISGYPGDIALFREYKNIKADNIIDKFGSAWIESHPDVSSFSVSGHLNTFLIRFCFFKMSPMALRKFIYDWSSWLSIRNSSIGALTHSVITNYALLDYLPELTSIIPGEQNNFMEIYNLLPHESAFLQAPDYIPSTSATNKGNGKFSEDDRYHLNMAAFLLLARYFEYLNQNGVYDNTRIIIVSDHGATNFKDYDGNMQIPNGQYLQKYHALLMFKDFNARNNSGEEGININNDFMSNADAALFAIKDIFDNPVNPFTQQPLAAQKENGLTITTSSVRDSIHHLKYEYKINSNQWLHVKDNIFMESNWSVGR